MTSYYYNLSLKTRQKPPKTVNFKYGLKELEHLNFLINATLKNARTIKSSEIAHSVNILKLLDKIIPNEFFGTLKHRKIFYQVIKRICTQSSFECMHKSAIVRGYDFKLIPWLVEVKNERDYPKLVMHSNLFLLERVVKPLIAFYYKPVKTYVGHEIRLVPRGEWNSFESKVFEKLKALNHLVKNEGCLKHKPRGHLIIVPKGSLNKGDFRPIVNIFRDSKKLIYKRITSKVYGAARKMSNVSSSLYERWKRFVEVHANEELFGTKLDIKDAYGNVDLLILTNLVLKLRNTFLSESDTNFVIDHVTNQFVSLRKGVYQWKHGLLQGDRLSSCLCELYMASIDQSLMSRFPSNCFLHRTVDDYFFCSTEPYRVDQFTKLLKNCHSVNETKTKANILYRYDNEIPYCGKVFNLKTKEVKNLYTFPSGFEIRHKFKLWNYQRQVPHDAGRLFLEKAMTFCYNNNSFTKVELNTIFNSEQVVLENFFDGMIYLGYKFDAAVMSMRGSFVDDFDFVLEVLERTVHKYSVKVFKKIEKCKGRYYKQTIKYGVLKALAYRAFRLVLKKRSKVYETVIAVINSKKLMLPSNVSCSYFSKLPKKFTDFKINRSI